MMTFAKQILQKTINFLKSLKGIFLSPCKLEIVYKQGVHFLELISLQLLHVNFIMKMST
jgi:hypothetical protein